MRTTTVTLHNASDTLLLTLVVRDADGQLESPVRNYEPVQPPGSELQAAFGDGTIRAGALERDFAFCNVSSYASIYHAKAALDAALESTASIRVSGWELPIAATSGVIEWGFLAVGLRARIRFIPASPYWSLLTDPEVKGVGFL